MTQKATILQELTELHSSLPASIESPAFSGLPAGYFEQLAGRIISRLNGEASAADELALLSPFLTTVSTILPYQLPSGYFEQLSPLELIKADHPLEELNELSGLLAAAGKQMPYQLPEGYFNETSEALAAAGADQHSTVLAGIAKTNPYTLPETYFDSFPSTIQARLQPAKARVVSVTRRTWFRMAAAAVIAGCIAIGALQLWSDSSAEPTTDESKVFASVTPQINKISDKQLEEFVQVTGATKAAEPAPATTAAPAGKTPDLNTLLQNISDTKLKAFLDETGGDEDEEESF